MRSFQSTVKGHVDGMTRFHLLDRPPASGTTVIFAFGVVDVWGRRYV
jgi:hypothetical protein